MLLPSGWISNDHLNADSVGQIANSANVKSLIITHRYPPALNVDIERQIRRYYKGSLIWLLMVFVSFMKKIQFPNSIFKKSQEKNGTNKWSNWFGLLPMILVGLAFEFLPLLTILQSSTTRNGVFTLDFYKQAMNPMFLRAFSNSISLSAITATLGVIVGTIVAYAIITSPHKLLKNALTALSDVTTNFGELH